MTVPADLPKSGKYDAMTDHYPRDLIGYAGNPPAANWPKDARLAVNFVLNYEEGAERCILHGDRTSETALSELFNPVALVGERDLNMESNYEYGSRVGFWRLLRLFEDRRVPFTAYAVGMALDRNPAAGAALARLGCDFVSHHYRWIDYHNMNEAEERVQVIASIRSIEKVTGKRPLGFYCGRPSANTRRLAAEEGFVYDCDAYNDDLPYWTTAAGRRHLVIPHTLHTNDSRYTRGQDWSVPGDMFTCLKADFDWLYREGERLPSMVTFAFHNRLAGRPGRAAEVARLVDYVLEHEHVWVCRRDDIYRHWVAQHPAPA